MLHLLSVPSKDGSHSHAGRFGHPVIPLGIPTSWWHIHCAPSTTTRWVTMCAAATWGDEQFWNVAFFIHNSRLAVNTLGQFPAKSCRMTRLSTLVKPSANQRCWTFRCWAISGFKRMHEVRTLCNQSSSWYSDWMLRTCFHTCLGTQQSTDGVGTHQIQQLVQTDCQFVQQKVTNVRRSTSLDWFRTDSRANRRQ